MTCPLEHVEATMLMRAVLGAEADWPELRFFAAWPNGGHRSRKTAAALKAEGVRSGPPDYWFPIPRGGFAGLVIELKRVRGGRVEPEQREWLDMLEGNGWRAEVCRGWEQAWAVLRDYLASDGAANDDEVT